MKQSNTVIVSGASGGIGEALLTQLHPKYRVIALSRSMPKTEDFAEHIAIDFADEKHSGWNRISDIGSKQPIYALIHLAGFLGERVPIIDQNISIWMHAFMINVHSTLRLTQCCWNGLNMVEDGRCMITTSGAARGDQSNIGAYGVTKATLEKMAQSLVCEIKNNSPKIVLFNPGPTATKMRAEVCPNEDQNSISSASSVASLIVEKVLEQPLVQGSFIDAAKILNARAGD